MQPATTPRKKLRSPGQEAPPNPKTSITCSNVPESLFDPNAATKHFSKFGRVQRIRLFPKRLACIVEFDVPNAVERAVLNAGAYDGFMFDVTRTKPRVRKRSKKDDDPDWVPDSDVAEELSAMGGAPSYRLSRQKPMEIGLEEKITRVIKATPPKKKTLVPVARKPPKSTQPTSGIESPVVVTTTQTTMSTFEAAAELHQLRYKVSLSPDEQWRILDARDRILRAWGGAGARVKVGGATIGTCQDMCPEKELLHRQAEHQVMTLETVLDSDGQLEPWRAVKQYSRSSADQEIPMCYELRPADVLMNTCSYLLQEIADTTRPVSLADWFHFMWDRLRSIRKDITQQALCCSESIRLVEMCARFHAHCAARLADLEHTQFDQKLNTDNLTKCLQTLKHMYADVTPEHKPNEAEFRGYIALLNLGDANFWWEIKQLPENIQKSEPIIFAIHVFNALDNNNYVRFFRLIQQRATYLQACILLRYFNDVRARALARIVKAYAPRGGSKFPAMDIMNQLAFESVENMKSFINHYGLRFSRADEYELSIKLDRNQFIEDSDPYPIARSINLIESKRQRSVGKMIAGGPIPKLDYSTHSVHTSFSRDGRLTEQALVAEDQGFDTANDSNKDIKALKAEIQRLAQGGKVYSNFNEGETKPNLFVKPDIKTLSPKPKSIQQNIAPVPETIESKQFFFKPAITVAPTEVIKNSPEKLFADKNTFSFSKPQETVSANVFIKKDTPFASTPKNIFVSKSNTDDAKHIFEAPDTNVDLFKNAQNVFKSTKPSENLFKKPEMPQSIFGQVETKQTDSKPQFGIKSTPNIFAAAKEGSLFTKTDSPPKFDKGNNIFAKPAPVEEIKGSLFTKTEIAPKFDRGNNIFANPIAADETKSSLFTKTASAPKFDKSNNIFAKPASSEEPKPANIFGAFSKPAESTNIFAQTETQKKSIFSTNGDITGNTSPGSLFKTACNPPNGSDSKGYSIFQSKNKAQTVADNILNSVNATNHNNVYDYDKNDEEILQRELDEKIREEQRLLQENIRKEEEQRQEQLRLEEERRKEEARRKQEEQRLEERRKQEEKIQEEKRQQELKKRLEEEKKAELKRKAEEEERKFKEAVDRESKQLVEDLVTEVVNETNKELLKSEQEDLMQIVKLANNITDEITRELSDEISHIEMKAELFLTRKIMKKWFYIWQKQFYRNLNRRKMLDDTPVWIPDRTPVEEALYLRRRVENAALKNMNAIHKGYKFSGEPNQLPPPEPYNIMDIIRSPLLKRMKQINYPYDRCFFWKVTMISPGENKWLYKKINVQNWIIDAFSDKKKHESDTLIHVSKQSWNHLMDFAISVSLVNEDTMSDCLEAIEGTNGVLFYSTDYDTTLIKTIEQTLKLKYPYQNIPVAIITPKIDDAIQIQLQELLSEYVSQKIISGYKIFALDSQDVNLLLNNATKTALKWLAKKYPPIPPIEIDYLKSICQRYLGNEIWCRFRTERNHCMYDVIKDINKLIECYNVGVDKLTEVITNEDLFNYPSFPLEFKSFLDSSSPYPKPYEFIPSNVRNSENISTIKDYMKLLKLPTASAFNPKSVAGMQQQIRTYCNQIGWFEDPEEVVCKVVAVIPNELSDINMPHEDFTKYFAQYNLIDFLNIIIYEKINRLNNFNNRFAIYDKAVLREHCNFNWLYELRVITDMKHRALEYEDELDYYIEAKRRKVELDSLEYLMLEDKDSTIVEENIKSTEINISKYSNCSEAVKQLEIELDEKVKQSEQFENMLRAALADV